MVTLDHEADLQIVDRLIPLKAAADVAADLQLCAVYFPESIPAHPNMVLIHLEMVSGAASFQGLTWVTKKAPSPDNVFLSSR